jgi:Domain of unknown function (DUF5122) beta-propeller
MKSKQWFNILSLLFLISVFLSLHQSEAASWARTYGGGGSDTVLSMQLTSDGGYVVTGVTDSFASGNVDLWVLKLKASGAIAWQKAYGGSSNEAGYDIQQTADGSYIVAGYTTVSGNQDIWILKLDSVGNIIWQKKYDDGLDEWAIDVEQTADGGFIVGGQRTFAGPDLLILKLDPDGNISWQKTYSGSESDILRGIHQTVDGGFIVAAETLSFGHGSKDLWVLKLGSSGNIQWQKTYGGTSHDECSDIKQTTDGGYILVGATSSYGLGEDDAWVLKLNSSGDISWQKTYGFSATGEGAFNIEQTPTDGGYIVAGTTQTSGNAADVWLIKLDSAGSILFQETLGGNQIDEPTDVHQLPSGHGYILAAQTLSFGSGIWDVWLLRLNNSGAISRQCPENITNSAPNNSNATAETSNSSPADTFPTADTTTVTPHVTNAVVYLQCGSK